LLGLTSSLAATIEAGGASASSRRFIDGAPFDTPG
jgi:hypothetical protein